MTIDLDGVRRAMADAGVDALVLRPSPDFRFLGGHGDDYLVVTMSGPPVETADPAGLVPADSRRVGVDDEMRIRELFSLAVAGELVPASAVLAPLRLRKLPHEVDAVAQAAARAEIGLRGDPLRLRRRRRAHRQAPPPADHPRDQPRRRRAGLGLRALERLLRRSGQGLRRGRTP